jgi:hypothetical protein
MNHFKKTIKKFNGSQHEAAFAFCDGFEAALAEVLNTGDDAYWTELNCRMDGNNNPSWYVDLYSCDQAQFMAMQREVSQQ